MCFVIGSRSFQISAR
ncbi:UNVERIFIED_CONTAM: hypothetical protein GTU68_004692 [Idotea baltica]|nr:hypothetical protein [Idotea baltica]